MTLPFSVIHVSAQVRGVNGVGGLADVPFALARKQAESRPVLIITTAHQLPTNATPEPDLSLRLSDLFAFDSVKVGRVTLAEGVSCYVVQMPETIAVNSFEHGVYLSVAAIVLAKRLPQPYLLHTHDWNTGLAVFFAWQTHTPTVFTVHNAQYGYQGCFENPVELCKLLGLSDPNFLREGVTGSCVHQGRFNFLKLALSYADQISVVSPNYAKLCLREHPSGGLGGLFRERANDLTSLNNGIDCEEWNPTTDPYLPADCRFGSNDPLDSIFQKKRKLRAYLRAGYPEFHGLRDDSFFVSCLGRLCSQKLDSLWIALPQILERPRMQLCIFGEASKTDSVYVNRQSQLLRMPNLLSACRYDSKLFHVLVAASDAVFMPSVIEPCGLSQLVGKRYGCVPIVSDQVASVTDASSPRADGFVYTQPFRTGGIPDAEAAVDPMLTKLNEAEGVFWGDRERWASLVCAVLGADLSWTTPSLEFEILYWAAVRGAKNRALLLSECQY